MHLSTKWLYLILILIAAFLIYQFGLPFARHLLLHYKSKKLYADLATGNLPWEVYSSSTEGNNIYYMKLGQGPDTVLIMGAFHGDEQTGFHLVVRLADSLYKNPGALQSTVVLVPVVNPDGLLKRSRVNANKVDINRNFPTENWSPVYKKDKNHPGREPGSERETQVVMALIEEFRPAKIITIHADLKMNNYDGPGEDLARLLSNYNHYRVTGSVGYATPGSFGTYAGIERKIPTVTLELPDIGPDRAWQQNGQALIAAINYRMD